MTHIQEEWKPVVGFEDQYEVSDKGGVQRVAPCKRSPLGGRLKPWLRGPRDGYLCVQLCGETRPVHRLVAEAFLGARPEGKVINHLDGNKHNNCVDNLEYTTHSANALHARDAGLTSAKLNHQIANLIRKRVQEGTPQRMVANEFGTSQANVSRIVNGAAWLIAP